MFHHLSIIVFVSSLVLWASVEPLPWVSTALEALDEVNDTKIFNAIYNSVKQWEKRQLAKHKHQRVKRAEPRVCYKGLGCFESSGPFGYLDMLPSSPEEISTKFLLYPGHQKRRSGFNYAEVPFSNVSDAFQWADKGFNTSLNTKVLIHGFGSGCSHVWVYELRSALMAVEETNLICVDWANGAELPNYVKAATNTRLVGKQLAILLKGLVEKTGLSARKMHLIGFSLGAHVAGFAGAEIANLSRITGLDPAGPLFESQDPRARLDQTDAEYVDVIHSNGENLILGGLGSWQPMGHVDFYPNGGRMQKGCTNLFVGAVSDIIWSSAIEGRSLCNHRRAYKFFTDSISPRCHFPAFPCESYEAFLEGRCFPCTDDSQDCGNMGYYADKAKGRGQLYLMTRDEEPFCAHQYMVRIESSSTDIPIVSYGKLQITFVGDVSLNETFTMTKKDDDEMKLGQSISRIVVPHPILAEPTKIQVLYTAYSGWISSGLTHWKIDRVILMDSFGKKSSICKKNLILESGVAVTLPLYAGECHVPHTLQDTPLEDRHFVHNTTFIPTPVVRLGIQDKPPPAKEQSIFSFRNAVDIFGWQFGGNTINVDEEKESSRALNTRVHVTPDSKGEETIREVVEPVLKPHSSKNARSHDLSKNVEISEPILRATTLKSPVITKYFENTAGNKEIEYNFYDTADGWVPSQNPSTIRTAKWKREDDSDVFTGFDYQKSPDKEENDIFNIFKTVQFLPQRLARMFEQAEKYARETILPFISTHTPKIIREFITPQEATNKYLPLHFEDTPTTKRAIARSNNNFNPPPRIPVKLIKSEIPTNISSTTPYTNIQKIRKKETVQLVFANTTKEADNSMEKKQPSKESSDQQKYIPLS